MCASCLEIAGGNAVDVIEIDAASNRGINEMRELRENVRYRPARDRYKVFIVDEAHQITNEAFNALLKTLEEPPEWVVFVLCTTEVHKIPTTIASRCQQFSFRSVDFAEVVEAHGMDLRAGRDRGRIRKCSACWRRWAKAACAIRSRRSIKPSPAAATQLNAAEVRGLLGMFSLDSLGEVTQALAARGLPPHAGSGDGAGTQRPQPAAFLPRAGPLLPEPAGGEGGGANTRLIAASAPEQERLAEVASGFSEEDLTRYLQLTLDLFKDLQFSLQPRLHLEIGLLRLIQAGKLVPIEEALADLGGTEAAAPPPPVPRRSLTASASATSKPPGRRTPDPTTVQPRPARQPPAPVAPNGHLAGPRLHTALLEAGMQFTADAVEHSRDDRVERRAAVLHARRVRLAMNEKDILKVVQKVAGRPMRVKITLGEPNAVRGAAIKPPHRRCVRARALAPRSPAVPGAVSRTRKSAWSEI